jgi:uncharacterized membrane protein YfcA
MVFDWTLLPVLGVLFLATLLRSAVGFGDALIAVPLLTLVIELKVAAPLAVLLSITVAGVIILQDWQHIHVRSAGWLVVSTLFGIPVGLWLLKTAPEPVIKSILAIVILIFSTYCLVGQRGFALSNDRFAWLFGLSAGVLGGAYGMSGPPLVIYGALRRWTPQHFRATLQGYFLPASVAGMVGYWFTGLWVLAVTEYYLLSLPMVWPAVVLGRRINQRLKGRSFLVYIHIGLIIVALMLFTQALWRLRTGTGE